MTVPLRKEPIRQEEEIDQKPTPSAANPGSSRHSPELLKNQSPQENLKAVSPKVTKTDEAVERQERETVSGDIPLLSNDERQKLQNRWNEIQTGFVDQPRDTVQNADKLVASAMERMAQVFSAERSRLEQQWDRGDTVSTEDLRVALQRYRTFFHRVLSI